MVSVVEEQITEGSGLLHFLNRLEQQHATQATLEYGMNNYIDRIAREKGVPIKGTFELTPLCNLNCKMCYVHLSQEQIKQHGKKLLTGTQWIQIMQQAIDNGMLYALLTGGEALLHPDFDEIYLFLMNHGIQVSINTNGLLLDAKRIEFFRRYPPRDIRITLYGANDDVYEAVTGKRAFHRVLDGICRVRDAGLSVLVSMTPSRYMPVDDALTVVQLLKKMGVRYGINSTLSKPREETGRAEDVHDMSLNEYVDLYKRVSMLQGEQLHPLCEEQLPQAGGGVKEQLKGFLCGGGRSSFAIVWHGAMQPCLTFTDVQVDVMSKPFTQAWQQVNERVRNHSIPRECCGCAYERLCPVCVAQHAEDAPTGHASPRLCERAKRLFKEGLVSLQL